MLYDNALLVPIYLEAYQITHNEHYKKIATEILNYVEKEMMSSDGGFFSATDADSLTPNGEREEGWYFSWTPDEIDSILNKKERALFKAYYGLNDSPNFEGRTLLNIKTNLLEVGAQFELSESEALNLIQSAKQKLYQVRAQRPAPFRDEKIITSWNALMISAFAHAGRLLNEPHFVDVAQKSANFIVTKMLHKNHLSHNYKDGKAYNNAYLDDYVFMTKLLIRDKPKHDGAIPSGNSIAILNLLRLYEFTFGKEYYTRAQKAFEFLSHDLSRAPLAFSEALLALDFYHDAPREIVIITPKTTEEAAPFLKVLNKQFIPNHVLVLTTQKKAKEYAKWLPLTESKIAMDNKTTAYVCQNNICKAPTTDLIEFEKQLSSTGQP